MSDLLFRGRGPNISPRAPSWLVRLCGAVVGLGIAQLAEALGLWVATGISGDWARLVLLALGALLAPSAIGAWLWILAGALTTTVMVAWYTPLVAALAPTFVRSDAPGATPDAIVVFSGDVTSSGRVRAAALERLLDALAVAHARGISALGLSVVADERDDQTPSSERDQRELVALALPGADVRFVRNVHSTHDEALAFAALARTHQWHRVLAITSPTHTGRACATLEQAGVSVECRPAVERVYDLSRLDRPGNRRLATADVVYELAARWLYRLRGWTP